MPYDRFKFIQLLIKHEGRLTTDVIEKELHCHGNTALRNMKIFETFGVVDIKTLAMGGGHPVDYVELKEEFKNLLSPIHQVNLDSFSTQAVNSGFNSKTDKNNTVFDEYTNVKMDEFDKNE
jgi:predicted ArsR family transcriptional regulator